MHTEVEEFVAGVKFLYPEYFTKKKVLEVGSLDINGSVRQFFRRCDYLGIDLAKGKGVDKVCPIHELDAPGSFDVVISTEMLEHDVHWQKSLQQMYKNVKAGGLLVLTCAAPNRPEHGTKRTSPQDSPFTSDYYRNISKEDFLSVLPESLFSFCHIKYERDEEDLLFWGIKNESST